MMITLPQKSYQENLKNNLLVQEKALKDAYSLQFQQNKKLQELLKMEKKLQKIYLIYYNLLIAQDLWKAHSQILSIIFLKEFIKINVNKDTMIKNVKFAELNLCIATLSLNRQTLKII